MRILWITNIPSPYRVDFFNELGKQSDLAVVCESRGESDRDSSWLNFDAKNFRIEFLSEGADINRHIEAGYDFNVVTNYYTKAGMKAIAHFRRKKIPYIIEGDGAFAGSGKGIKEALKRWLIGGAAFVFSTSEEHDRFYETYGISKDRIVRYPFTSLKQSDILDSPVLWEKKQQLRKELGIKEEKIILSVGQFIPRKGYDVLIKAMARLKDENIGCYIVGGTPTQEYINLVNESGVEDKIHFAGFKLKDELNKYYMVADLFVLPTREDIWGLVINEAMAKGLPVVTTTRCIAGLELIKEPLTGELTVPEDDAKLAEAIKNNMILSEKRSNHVLKTIRPYSIENMARVHLDIFGERMLK